LLRANQSLKLTEVAVDDFAAREFAGIDMISGYVRATRYMELTVLRRSHVSLGGVKRHLAPVRQDARNGFIQHYRQIT